MVSLNKYYVWFFILCFVLSLVSGVLMVFLPNQIAGILTAMPYLIAMIIVLYRFLKQQQRAPTHQERKKLTLGFTLIFWGYNLIGMLVGAVYFSRNDPEVWSTFVMYMQSTQFLLTTLIMILLFAIPLYLITYWFYGKQAQRMANKMFP
ncbi:ABZJ_00895 family protein [Acinetobacter sp. ANC 4648]|uniref:ABZJ_00895 family protein n=1 Tax=Acinetobacter sp. ANC 4648 TaxID=1977875 RepID=UPI000A33B57C|nr:ABZJ_00895 family protein [Acinetobacter sp. ANC 4648]OTG81080.1 hypothetical protein B9T27_11520 [Acinetobacter sp. ANC 4648]